MYIASDVFESPGKLQLVIYAADFTFDAECRHPPLPPQAKVLPWIGTTLDYIKYGPSSGERFHKELGPIYRYGFQAAASRHVWAESKLCEAALPNVVLQIMALRGKDSACCRRRCS